MALLHFSEYPFSALFRMECGRMSFFRVLPFFSKRVVLSLDGSLLHQGLEAPMKTKLDPELLKIFYEAFVRCPKTGRVLEVLKGDDKVFCPACQPPTHYWKALQRASAEDFIAQEQPDDEPGPEEEWVWVCPIPDEIQ